MGSGSGSAGFFALCDFTLSSATLTGEEVKSLVLRLYTERVHVDRELRLVNERVRQVVILRPKVLLIF